MKFIDKNLIPFCIGLLFASSVILTRSWLESKLEKHFLEDHVILCDTIYDGAYDKK